MILADEINRTPPRRRPPSWKRCKNTTSPPGRKRTTYQNRFSWLATQNPIERKGTYPLPEAQLDRFMFNIIVTYPNRRKSWRS